MTRIAALLCCVFVLINPLKSQEISRVEPPFWWAGMEYNQVELMIYGQGIGSLTPSTDHPSVRIVSFTSAENPNYAFLVLEWPKEQTATTVELKLGNLSTSFELKQRRDGSRDREGVGNKDVIYLITPDRFANGNPANDNFPDMPDKTNRLDPYGRHGGDIQGIVDHLDYLRDLGFTGVWLNPVLENNQPQSSYHGYSTTDFYKIDPRYGTNQEYRNLALQAEGYGIRIIMDMIANHIGSEHWWMKDLPSSDWINFDASFVPTNHKKPTIQDPYGTDYDRKRFTDGWFVKTMPDLNQRNPHLATYLIQNAIWWVEYAELAGIRMDTWPYSDKDFLTEWSCAIMREYPNLLVTGEEWVLNPNTLAYWQAGKANHDGYSSCLPSLLDFPLQNAVSKGLTEDQSDWSGLLKIYEGLSNDFIYADPDAFVTFPDNHDMDRIFTQLGEDRAAMKNALVYFLTSRGTPQIYYGTELLFTNVPPGHHGNIRAEFPGGWAGDPSNGFTGVGINEDQREIQLFIRTINLWRKTASAIHGGSTKHFVPYQNAYVYFRMKDNEMVMVVINRNEEDILLETNRLYEVLGNRRTGTNIITGEEMSLEGTLPLKANEPLIIQVN